MDYLLGPLEVGSQPAIPEWINKLYGRGPRSGYEPTTTWARQPRPVPRWGLEARLTASLTRFQIAGPKLQCHEPR